MDISNEYRELYDAAVKVWNDVNTAFRGLKDDGHVRLRPCPGSLWHVLQSMMRWYVETLQISDVTAGLREAEQDTKQMKTIRAAQFGSQLRFFRQLCTAAKVPHIIALTRKALADGHCVVIGLQSTGRILHRILNFLMRYP